MTRRPAPSSSPAAPKVNIIVDSGAYSAWRSGKPIDLDKYCDYLLANLDWMGSYVALDVINPGSPEHAAQASFDNLLHMRSRGLDPIPVFHVGEDISWLYRMLDLGCTYIGLSASSLVSRNKVDDWYAFAWSHLVNSDGLPIVKAHAFGEGRVESLKQFPFYSADTTSWIYSAQRAGAMDLPEGQRLAMRNDKQSSRSAMDIDHIDAMEQSVLDEILREVGVDKRVFLGRDGDKLEKMAATVARTYVTALYYLRSQEQVRAKHPIRFHPQGFLHNGYAGTPPAKFDAFNLHLVCGTNNMTYALVAKLQHTAILASYFYIQNPDPAIDQMNGYKFKSLREFCLDPVGMVSSLAPWNKYWNVLQEFIR